MKAWVGAAMCCLCVVGCDSDSGKNEPPIKEDGGAVPDGGEPQVATLRMIPAGESYEGKSPEEWAVEYMRWSNSQTSCENPLSDEDGARCGMQQENTDSPVFFFERSGYGQTANPPIQTRTLCRVPVGKAILVPIALLAVDNVGLRKPRTPAELQQIAQETLESMRSMVLKADDEDITGFSDHGIGPFEFEYRVPPAPNMYSCDEIEDFNDSVVTPSYAIGYMALFEPPAAGEYEVEFGSVMTFLRGEFGFHVRTHFAVEDAAD